MKKQISIWFGSIFFVAILLLTTSCNNEESLLSQEESAIEDDELETREITPINLNVKVRNGALVFESPKDLRHAEDVLSNVDLASRLAWEESIGFKSLRGVYEKVLEDYYVDSSFNLESAKRKYSSIIDFSTPMPTLKNHDVLVSSILSLEYIVYVGEAVGMLNKEGSFWIRSGSLDKLNEVLQNQEAKTDVEAGVIVVRKGKNDPDRVDSRSCTINPGEDYVDSETINNGTNNGSTQLVAQFGFYSDVIAYPSVNSVEQRGKAYLLGWAFRRKTCGCGWKEYQDDHIFSWNVELGIGYSGPITTYTGTDIHANVHRAQRVIFDEVRLYQTGTHLDKFYYLNKIDFDTRHTTDNLDLPGVSYMCQ